MSLLLLQSVMPWALVHAQTMAGHVDSPMVMNVDSQAHHDEAHCPSMASKNIADDTDHPDQDKDPAPIESVCERACALVQVLTLTPRFDAYRGYGVMPEVNVWVSHHAYPAKIPTPPPIS